MSNHSVSGTTHTQPTRIAIAGATGRVGSALTTLLAGDSVDVVALSRKPDGATVPAGVAVASVDFDRHDTLRSALAGADQLFLSQGTSPRQVENEIALIDAAVAVGVRHIVKLSALGPASHLVPFAFHMEIEAHLARQSIASTVLRPTAFMYLLKRAATDIVAGQWGGAAGDGRINFIDTRDIADAARAALLNGFEPDSQRVYHLSGPRAWTMAQVGEAVSRLLGRKVTYLQRTLAEQRALVAAASLPPFVVDLIVGLDQVFRDSAIGETTSTFKELTGKAPRSLTAWLTEHIAAFQG